MRSVTDSEFIFGLHDPGGEQLMLDADRPGWLLLTEALGSDPHDISSRDYSHYSSQGLGIIVRLNNGYYPVGTIPYSNRYQDFARRCANFVANSRGCRIWIIGNEMNYRIERPQDASLGTVLQFRAAPDDPYGHGNPERFSALRRFEEGEPGPVEDADAVEDAVAGEVITPELYARCYTLCRQAIHGVTGHEEDQVLIGAVAPWNNQTAYAGNENGDWVLYFRDILESLGSGGYDGIALHTYTHQADPNLIHSDAKMDPPFQQRHYEFRAYRDFMNAIPPSGRRLPVYITETDQDVPWLNADIGWVWRAYGEIDYWNQQPGSQQIRALILYRWPKIDRWYIEGKQGVIEDFRQALAYDYRWRQPLPKPADFRAGDHVVTTMPANLRRSPGYLAKPPDDVVAVLPAQHKLSVLSSRWEVADDLIWWNLATSIQGTEEEGWMSQTTQNGEPLLESEGSGDHDTFQPGDRARTLDITRVRRTPGYVGKPPEDTIAYLPVGTDLWVIGGPKHVDDLTWWQVKGFAGGEPQEEGWVAEQAPGGILLLEKVEDDVVAPPPPPPEPSAITPGDTVYTLDTVRMRRSPGYVDKPAEDVVADLPPGTEATVLEGPQPADGLTWWYLRTVAALQGSLQGWVAESAPGGLRLLEKSTATAPTDPPARSQFQSGDLVQAATLVSVRRAPGLYGKPDGDVLGAYSLGTTVNLNSGPQERDGLNWWQVGGIGTTAVELVGWAAENMSDGTPCLRYAPALPATDIPDHEAGSFLHLPYVGSFGIAQLWGENPQIYSQFKYDGVALMGHNGIDFLTPRDTVLVSVDDGVVEEAELNHPSGLGNYVKLRHAWGESLYAHLSSLDVYAGQSVGRGESLGTSGTSGFSGGPHLHFSIRIHPYDRADGWGGFSDPLPYLDPAEVTLPPYVLPGVGAEIVSYDLSGPLFEYAPIPRSMENAGLAPDRSDVRRP